MCAMVRQLQNGTQKDQINVRKMTRCTTQMMRTLLGQQHINASAPENLTNYIQ